MYCTTIAKLKGKEWAGFNMMSQLLLEGDLERELNSYGLAFKTPEKGELTLLETEWNSFTILIQYRRIS